jgi:hypothetical protein
MSFAPPQARPPSPTKQPVFHSRTMSRTHPSTSISQPARRNVWQPSKASPQDPERFNSSKRATAPEPPKLSAPGRDRSEAHISTVKTVTVSTGQSPGLSPRDVEASPPAPRSDNFPEPPCNIEKPPPTSVQVLKSVQDVGVQSVQDVGVQTECNDTNTQKPPPTSVQVLKSVQDIGVQTKSVQDVSIQTECNPLQLESGLELPYGLVKTTSLSSVSLRDMAIRFAMARQSGQLKKYNAFWSFGDEKKVNGDTTCIARFDGVDLVGFIMVGVPAEPTAHEHHLMCVWGCVRGNPEIHRHLSSTKYRLACVFSNGRQQTKHHAPADTPKCPNFPAFLNTRTAADFLDLKDFGKLEPIRILYRHILITYPFTNFQGRFTQR